ncbi:MAG: Nif3-like dinuclear metal center hexameric protein [Methanomicrobiales archaeon]|nr:Nif3-like dinuclear metal center hexameric protein [Methanomicrobiales archaeon]
MDIQRFIAEMERIAPPALAEPFDEGRIGLVVEGKPEIERVCSALDLTPRVLAGARAAGADMLVVHHTPIWTPVTTVHGRLAGLLKDVLATGMNVYVMHSNFDRAPGGINDTLAGILGLEDVVPMSLGAVGTCRCDTVKIARTLGCPLRIYGDPAPLRSLAVVGGSGFDPGLLHEAEMLRADAFLSAEARHATLIATPLTLLEATHYALEAPGMQRLAERMAWTFLPDPPRIATVP